MSGQTHMVSPTKYEPGMQLLEWCATTATTGCCQRRACVRSAGCWPAACCCCCKRRAGSARVREVTVIRWDGTEGEWCGGTVRGTPFVRFVPAKRRRVGCADEAGTSQGFCVPRGLMREKGGRVPRPSPLSTLPPLSFPFFSSCWQKRFLAVQHFG
jgi:hypothetical protein